MFNFDRFAERRSPFVHVRHMQQFDVYAHRCCTSSARRGAQRAIGSATTALRHTNTSTMTAPRRHNIADLLRQRILRALETGALRHGDRLASTREMGRELSADPRVVSAAYRLLAAEGLVDLRPRSGSYVAADPPDEGAYPPAQSWLTAILADGVLRGTPGPALGDWVTRALTNRRVRAVAIATTTDQSAGICRELAIDYGVRATAVLAETLGGLHADPPLAVRRAHLLVTTAAHGPRVRALAARFGNACVVASVRPDLIKSEWRMLMQRPAYIVVADPRFVAILRGFLAGTPGEGNVRVLVVGRDDQATIPADATTYVTQSARERLGATRLPGRLIPPTRIFAEDCVREIMRTVVELNLRMPPRA
jgi:DNA-binding transcriptional regulator YhcF (GntR family)